MLQQGDESSSVGYLAFRSQEQRLRLHLDGLVACQQRLERRPRRGELARVHQPSRRLQEPSPLAVLVDGRCQACGLARQLGSGIDCASAGRCPGGLLDDLGDGCFRLGGRQRGVAAAFFDTVHDRSQAPVQLSPARW